MSPRILVIPGDLSGCGWARMILPARAAADAGADVVLAMPGDKEREIKITEAGYEGGFRNVLAMERPDCDVVVLQRAMDHRQAQAIPKFQEHGIKVVLEIDDDFHAISPRNVAYRGSHERYSPFSNRQWLMKASTMADLVTVTTPALAKRYGSHGRVKIIPNFIPDTHLTVQVHKTWDRPRVGWLGQVGTHPDDLQVMRGGLAKAVRAADGEFYVVGGLKGVSRAVGLPEDRLAEAPWGDRDSYPRDVAQMDVGIVPLDDTAFNQAKSWIKGIEYAGLGVPFVASPTDPYIELTEKHGFGLLAKNPKDWAHLLARYLINPTFRDEISADYRHRAVKYTYSANVHRWIDAWEGLCSSN